MSKPVWRGMPSALAPSPVTTLRRERSLTSRTRRQVISCRSRSSSLPWKMWLSTTADSRLWAAVTAWKSPVRCRLRISIGTTWLKPPPAAPPLMPKVGPIEGWRMVIVARLPMWLNAWPSPTVVVVLPSPSGVGVIALTTTYLARGRSASCSMASRLTFITCRP